MSSFVVKNNAESLVVDNPLAQAAVTLNVTASEGANFPSTFPFLITIWDESSYIDPGDDSGMEIVKCTARATDALTIVRGQEGTGDVAHANGERVAMLITAGILNDATYGLATKLDGIESGATKYPDTGEQAFLDADHTKLDGIAAGADAMHSGGMASVFSGTAPSSYTDLDLSGTIGSRIRMVWLAIEGNSDVAFVRTKGDTTTYADGYTNNIGFHCALTTSGKYSTVQVLTDSNGVLQWYIYGGGAANVLLMAYI